MGFCFPKETEAFSFSYNFTPTSQQPHTDFNAFFYLYLTKRENPQNKEVMNMFLGLEWYWWLVILAVLAISIPFKVKFMKWWNGRQQEKKKEQRGKWGDEDD